MVKVYSYDSGERLDGTASEGLIEASEAEGATGAVPAYRDGSGVWHHVEPSMVDHVRRNLREDVVTVYVD